MSFDLYFAGARHKLADAYLLEHNGNRLQSQLVDRNNIEIWCKEKTKKSKLFIDSGAYTAYTKGAEIDVDEYIKYLNSITDKCTIFAQLDKIPGRFNQPKTSEDVKNAPKQSWENYLYMRERLKEPKKLLPIFHQGENYKWLHNMLEWTDENGEHIPYIGISPAFDVPGLEYFLDRSFSIIQKSSNPKVKTHAFGMTRLKVLELYPYTSADSTSWKMCAAMGNIYTPWGTIYVGDRRPYDKDYYRNQPKQVQQKVDDYINQFGFPMKEVINDFGARAVINIRYLMDWASNYKYKGCKVRKRTLF